MAKIVGQDIHIVLNKLVKNGETDEISFLDDEVLKSLEKVVEQLINDNSIVVEVISEK